jgi:hypothetical protein
MYVKPFCFMQSARIDSIWRLRFCGSSVEEVCPTVGVPDTGLSPQPDSTARARMAAGMAVRTRDMV